MFGINVDVWEVGNEINGEWIGFICDVIDKIMVVYEVIRVGGGCIVFMLYYNEGCVE